MNRRALAHFGDGVVASGLGLLLLGDLVTPKSALIFWLALETIGSIARMIMAAIEEGA